MSCRLSEPNSILIEQQQQQQKQPRNAYRLSRRAGQP